jgi:hypothetical protein
MDENRVEGSARNLGGRVQEGFGKVTGDARRQMAMHRRGCTDRCCAVAEAISQFDKADPRLRLTLRRHPEHSMKRLSPVSQCRAEAFATGAVAVTGPWSGRSL